MKKTVKYKVRIAEYSYDTGREWHTTIIISVPGKFTYKGYNDRTIKYNTIQQFGAKLDKVFDGGVWLDDYYILSDGRPATFGW